MNMNVVEVKAGDMTVKLFLGVNEVIAAQKALGVDSDVASLAKIRSFGEVRTLVFHGLRKLQPSMTEEQAGDVITAAGMPAITAALRDALAWAMPGAVPGPTGLAGGKEKRRRG
jgi:hypothetical protein